MNMKESSKTFQNISQIFLILIFYIHIFKNKIVILNSNITIYNFIILQLGFHTTSAVPQTDHLHATLNWGSN